jgi:hypothetical protein
LLSLPCEWLPFRCDVVSKLSPPLRRRFFARCSRLGLQPYCTCTARMYIGRRCSSAHGNEGRNGPNHPEAATVERVARHLQRADMAALLTIDCRAAVSVGRAPNTFASAAALLSASQSGMRIRRSKLVIRSTAADGRSRLSGSRHRLSHASGLGSGWSLGVALHWLPANPAAPVPIVPARVGIECAAP